MIRSYDSQMGVSGRIRLIIVTAFGLSGAAGLMLEILWFRVLGIGGASVGTTAAAITASYMAGLALGSRLGALLADRVRYRLRLYASMEILVAISAWIVPRILERLVAVVDHHPLAWGMVGLVLLVPTTAIGTGLPLLTASLTRSRQRAASTSALLYGVNTAGAMLGVAWTGFLGLPQLGPEVCSSIAVLLLAAIGGVALWVSLRVGPQPGVELSQWTAQAQPRRLVLGSAAVASAAAMMVQVGWTQLAARWFQSPATTFAGVVLVFLLGLSLGGLLASRWVQTMENVERALSVVLGATGISVGVALLLGVQLAPRVDGIAGELLVLLLLLPATVLMGLIYPLFVSLYAKRGASVGTSVGVASAASTVGAIAGSLVGAALLPAVGEVSSVCGSLAIYAFLGTAVRIRLG